MQRATRLFRATSQATGSAPRPQVPSPSAATSRRHCTSQQRSSTSVLAAPACSPRDLTNPLRSQIVRETFYYSHHRYLSTTTNHKMSFSNTNTGGKPADPYKEKNKDEPGVAEKVKDLSDFVQASKFGMMTTKASGSDLLVSRCMALAAQEGGGVDLIFHTNTESGKTDDLEKDSSINMAFLNSSGSWASISGKASIITDRDVVKKYYSPALKTWLGDLGDGKHDGSENDPRIGVIKIEAKTATYAISTGNPITRGVEMVQGAITGNAATVNKLRELSESEISQYRTSH